MERYELTPIGISGDFNPSGNKTSHYMIINGTMYLFDVPYSTVDWFMGKNGHEAMANVDNVAIFITSLKESRIGGLKALMDILVSIDINHTTYFPKEIWMKGQNYIEITGGILSEFHMMRGDFYQDANVQIFDRRIDFDGIIPAFAYVIYGGDLFISETGTNWSVYYAPDNRIFMDDATLASFIAEPREKTIYHGVTYDVDNSDICYKDRMIKSVPRELRGHVYPINISDNKDIKKLRNQGFNV